MMKTRSDDQDSTHHTAQSIADASLRIPESGTRALHRSRQHANAVLEQGYPSDSGHRFYDRGVDAKSTAVRDPGTLGDLDNLTVQLLDDLRALHFNFHAAAIHDFSRRNSRHRRRSSAGGTPQTACWQTARTVPASTPSRGFRDAGSSRSDVSQTSQNSRVSLFAGSGTARRALATGSSTSNARLQYAQAEPIRRVP
jgi:hypothetical protein